MASIEELYSAMSEPDLNNAYETSSGKGKKIIEKVLEKRSEEFSLTEVFKDDTVVEFMKRLKEDNLDSTARSVILKTLTVKYDEVEQYIYEKLSSGNYSHKLVEPLELSYRLSLANIEKLYEVVNEGKEYEALDIFKEDIANIDSINETLLAHYRNLYLHKKFFKYFKSERMKKYNYSLLNLTSEDDGLYNSLDSYELAEELEKRGYSSKHWFINNNIINQCEYLFKVLTDLIEPDYEDKNYEIVHDFTDTMTPEEYESYCATILDENGWEASVTKTTGDQGADVIGRKNGIVIIIQCKLYSSPVGNKAVQEVHAALSHYGGMYGIVVTNNTFTNSAEELASSTNTYLIHHDELGNILNKLENSSK